MKLKKREWFYAQSPATYEMAGCECGNNDCEWSEFEKHLWCAKCEKDFTPKHSGLFDGPVGINLCEMVGIFFHQINTKSGKLRLWIAGKGEKARYKTVNLNKEELSALFQFARATD